MKVYEHILISSLTTMRLGGPARFVLEIEQPADLPEAYAFAEQFGYKTFILGGGSNSLGYDNGFPGAILINRMRGITEKQVENRTELKIMGGEPWDSVVEYAVNRNLTGIEAMAKIPGLTGAAPVGNIGAYGQEIADTLTEIEVYDNVLKTFKILKKSDLNFSYRKSLLNTTSKNRFFVISVTLSLATGEMPRPFYNSIEKYIFDHKITDFSPKSIYNIVSEIRADKLPDPKKIPSAGSFFKNVYLSNEDAEKAEEKGYPVHRGKDGNKINSGWFIEQVGLKGQLLHGFRVSEKAPLVLINETATSFTNLANARSEITTKIYDKFGYWLEQEPVEIN